MFLCINRIRSALENDFKKISIQILLSIKMEIRQKKIPSFNLIQKPFSVQKSFFDSNSFFESTWDPDSGSDLVIVLSFLGTSFDQKPSFSQGFIRVWLENGGRNRALAGRAAGQPAPVEKRFPGY